MVRSPFISAVVLFSLTLTNLIGQSHRFDISLLKNQYDLNDKLFILPCREDTLSIEEVSGTAWQDQFVRFSSFLAENYPGQQHPVRLNARLTYWCRVKVYNQLPANIPLDDWILFTGKSNITEVYVVHADRTIDPPRLTGLTVPAKNKDFRFGNQQHDRVRISLPPSDSISLFLKVKSPNLREPWINVNLSPEDYFHTWDYVVKSRKDWMFIGFLLTFALVNLILFLGTKDRVFLYHFLFQVGIFVYLLEFFYMLYDLVWLRDHPILVQAVIYLALGGMDLAYLQFIRTYMNLKRDYPKWDPVFKALITTRFVIMAGVILLFYTTNNMPLSDNITAAYMILQYVGTGILLLIFSRKDLKSAFLIAGTFMFILGVVLNGWSVIEGTGLRFAYTQTGVIGEVLLFTIGLGYRMKTLMEEQRQTQRLRDLDEFKTRFYTQITHEFRTPLTLIGGMTDQLREELPQPAIQNKLDVITSSGNRLLQLVNRMLELATLQSGKAELHLRQHDIIEFLRYLVFSFQSFAMSKDIHIRFLTELESYTMDFDAEKLQDVMMNLVSNAIKFTGRGGRITIKATVDRATDGSELFRIQVKDTGIGMSPEEMDHIFERFYRGASLKKSGQGSGLGLAITKELMKLMRGSIEVESEGGVGSVFTVVLPVTKDAPGRLMPDLPVVRLDVRGNTDEEDQEEADTHDEKPLVLIVEDNYDVVQFIRHLLEKEYRIVSANNGTEGTEKAVEMVPDVIISDVIMPGKDGLELCRTLKTDERTSHIPIVLLTAKARVEDRIAGLESGADAYLTKPFHKEELFLYLRNFLQIRQQLQERYSKMPDNGPEAEMVKGALFHAEDTFITKIRKLIEENIEDETFGVNQLCHKINMSRSQLHRKVKALTGESTSFLINGVRIAVAKKLLASTTLNVSEIAYQIGYEPNYFSRMFKETTGKTPTEYREEKMY